jgi:hypothetical protein
MRTLKLSLLLLAVLCITNREASAQVARLQGDTLRFPACGEGLIVLDYLYAGCDGAITDSIAISGLPASEFDISLGQRFLTDGLADTSLVRFHSKRSGTYPVTLYTSVRYGDWLSKDTTFDFLLIVDPNPGVLVSNLPDSIDFGKQLLCNAERLLKQLELQNVGCEDINVKSIKLELDQQPASEFNFTPSSAFVLEQGDPLKTIPISFKPSKAGKSTGRLIIDLGTSEDTIYVSGEGLEDSKAISISADTVKASVCLSEEGLATITNLSCRLMTLEDLTLPLPLELLPGQLPIGIPGGESTQVRVRFTAQLEGTQKIDGIAHLKFVGQNETVAFDTVLSLMVIGLPGTPMTVTTDTTINLGDVSICADRSFTVPIQSLGCDTLTITSATLAATNTGYSITTEPSALVPMNESTSVAVLFTPTSIGISSTDLVIMTNAGMRKITLIANVIPGSKVLTSSMDTIKFGETNICEERDSLVSFTNTGCDTLTITAADIDQNFSVGDGVLPIVLAPDESVGLPITTIVDTAGKPTVLTGTLSISSTADNQIAPIRLTRSLYYPTRLRIEAIDEASGKQGDMVTFRVLLEGQVPSTMTALHFDFLHNADLLSWDGYDGVGLNRTNISGNENERASFTLSPVHDGVIGEFSFRINLALAEQTTLSFDKITFEAKGISIAPECIAVISDTGTRFNYIYTCGDNIIRDRLNGTRLIKSITPNPAKDEVRLELGVLGPLPYVMYDALGAEVKRGASDVINVSELPSGTYYVRVSTSTDIQTKRVIISR